MEEKIKVFFKGDKGDKGEKGDKGDKGKDDIETRRNHKTPLNGMSIWLDPGPKAENSSL